MIHREEKIWVHAVLVVACFMICFPVVFVLVKASQSMSVVTSSSLFPGKELLPNIRTVWTEYQIGMYMRNSFFIAIWVTGGKIILSLLAATAIVFYDFKGKRFIFGFIICTLMMPTEIMILGLFEVVSYKPASSLSKFLMWLFNPKEFLFSPTKFGLGLGDTRLGIILPFLASATGVFLFRQHFMSIPLSIADSARMDGVNSLEFLWFILTPMSKNTIGALTVIQFVYVWDQYIWPRIIIRHNSSQVIQVGLSAITGAGDSILWNQVMTGSLLAMVPPLLVFGVLYRAFMKGYALSSDK
jgi:sn-glycerol 3-phosphate transport system permease protein